MFSEAKQRHLLFVAMAASSGMAGHHYSMRDLANAFSRQGWTVEVILFSATGAGVSAALADFSPAFVRTGSGFGAAIHEMRRIVQSRATDLVVAFDELANRISVCALLGRLEILLPVKPGWINSSSWSAASSEFIVFTAEDFLFFTAHPKYRRVRFNLISGRVEPPVVDKQAVEKLRMEVLLAHRTSKLAICPVRIERGKLFFIDAVLRSFERLRQEGERDLALLIIGAEQDPSFRKELELRTKDMPVSVRTDPDYTRRLSALLPSGDVVYAMGRTVMESLLLGRRTFCPSGRPDCPLWEVTPENFFVALSGNFTGRNRGEDLYRKIAVDPPSLHCDMSNTNLDQLVRHNMSAEGAVPQYLAAHARSIANPPTRMHQHIAYSFSRLRLAALASRSSIRKASKALYSPDRVR